MGPAFRDSDAPDLSPRQAAVLRAMVTAYLGEGSPIGSGTVASLVPMRISSASIRTTMAELAALGLIEKPHASSGRLPTDLGLRRFVDELLDPVSLGSWERRNLAYQVDEADAGEFARVASQLLSDCTQLVGFVVTPRLECLELRHVSLVRLSSERLLAVLVSRNGETQRRLVDHDGALDQPELDRVAVLLNERIAGRTLQQVRDRLAEEARTLRDSADRLLAAALELGARALAAGGEPGDLVIATRLALLDRPEFQDPARVRELLSALEDKEWLIGLLDELLAADGVQVAFSEDVSSPSLRNCAVVATPYGGERTPGALGVIGPSRMEYGRVIPLVAYLSDLVTEKLNA